MEEIFELLGQGVVDAIPNDLEFTQAALNIMRLDKVAEFKAYLISDKNEKLNLNISFGYNHAKAIHKLYDITQSPSLGTSKLEPCDF